MAKHPTDPPIAPTIAGQYDLSDYPTAQLGRPGTYPHRLLGGRTLEIAHHEDPHARPRTIEEAAADEGWINEAPETIARHTADERDRIERFDRGEWHYLGVVVSIMQTWGGQVAREIGSASCWQIESDSGDKYLTEIGRDLFDEAQRDLIALMGALTDGDPRARSRTRARCKTGEV